MLVFTILITNILYQNTISILIYHARINMINIDNLYQYTISILTHHARINITNIRYSISAHNFYIDILCTYQHYEY